MALLSIVGISGARSVSVRGLLREFPQVLWKRGVLWNSNSAKKAEAIKAKHTGRPIRNVGIVSHVDGGKTTTTERFLHYSGLTEEVGSVDEGTTVTDHLALERERGITIQSAAVSFVWSGHHINLIDTPGHVDFTMEVERSLRVLDGAVIILDSSVGVEAQTETVWGQANRYNVPRILYLNKMDKPAASLSLCISSVKRQLGVDPLLLQLPIGGNVSESFHGIVDLVTMTKLDWQSPLSLSNSSNANAVFGKECEPMVSELSPPGCGSAPEDIALWEEAVLAREDAVNRLAEIDDELADIVLSAPSPVDSSHLSTAAILDYVSAKDLIGAVRRLTISSQIVPAFLGSSRTSIGIEPIMDAVVNYLPSPHEVEREFKKCYIPGSLCALAFKTVRDPSRGLLTYIRLYAGELSGRQSVYNVNQGEKEKVQRIYSIKGGEYKEEELAGIGSIVAVTGLEQTVTGDTLTNRKASLILSDQENGADEDMALATVRLPEPVFMCTVEAPSMSKQKKLEDALAMISKEDPSLRVKFHPESGDITLSGMGDLHLEVVKHRLKHEYKLDVYTGPIFVEYRETLTDTAEETYDSNVTIRGHTSNVTVTLRLEPGSEGVPLGSEETGNETLYRKLKAVVVESSEEWDGRRLSRFDRNAITQGVINGLTQGPTLGFPVVGVKVTLTHLTQQGRPSGAAISTAASACIQKLLPLCSPVLLQPVMSLSVAIPMGYEGMVLSDLAQRRATIRQVSSENKPGFSETGSQFSKTRPGFSKSGGAGSDCSGVCRVIAKVPLSEMVGYATHLRASTSGRGSVTMELAGYELVAQSDIDALKKSQMF